MGNSERMTLALTGELRMKLTLPEMEESGKMTYFPGRKLSTNRRKQSCNSETQKGRGGETPKGGVDQMPPTPPGARLGASLAGHSSAGASLFSVVFCLSGQKDHAGNWLRFLFMMRNTSGFSWG